MKSPEHDATMSDADTAYTHDEDMPPTSLGPQARWEWKLRQLSYHPGLTPEGKMDRKRNTALVYANEADTVGTGCFGCGASNA